MGLNIGKAVSMVSKIGSAINVADLTSGLNINAGMSPSALPGLASTITSKLDTNKGNIMNQLTAAASELDVDSIVNSIDIESKATEMITSQGMDPQSLGLNEGQINAMISSSVNEMINNIGLDKINYG